MCPEEHCDDCHAVVSESHFGNKVISTHSVCAALFGSPIALLFHAEDTHWLETWVSGEVALLWTEAGALCRADVLVWLLMGTCGCGCCGVCDCDCDVCV